jgi:hypothetical protein
MWNRRFRLFLSAPAAVVSTPLGVAKILIVPKLFKHLPQLVILNVERDSVYNRS